MVVFSIEVGKVLLQLGKRNGKCIKLPLSEIMKNIEKRVILGPLKKFISGFRPNCPTF
jgi:hypothetical protein